ncbi:MAG: aminotransferase class IV [Alphaproteobacteria bacterium]|nr:aminotransferase class IV [Alphaproteobacteria bacterium]
MTQYCYVNGRFTPLKKAQVSVQDRGFRFGDGVFETVAVYKGLPYQWDLHMRRLKCGLQALEIPFRISDLRQPALQLISKNGLVDATLRIAISRGVGSIGYLPTGPADSTLVIEATRRITPPIDPATLWLGEIEKPSLQALPVQYKIAQGVNSTLARIQAAKHGCLDSLLLNAHGNICEAGSANVFWQKGDTLFTPALDCGVLDGTTRSTILRLSPYKIEQGSFPLAHLKNADAMVATNSTWQAMPITELRPNNWQFPDSVALASALRSVLHKDIEAYAAAHRA